MMIAENEMVSQDEIRQILTIKHIREDLNGCNSSDRIKLLTMAIIQDLEEYGDDIAVEAALEMIKERL